MSTNELLQVPEEFTKQNSEYAQIKRLHSKGGRVPKHVRDARRDDVNRLHFDYRYSARKIAKILNIPRPTIDSDIHYLYSQAGNNTNLINPEIQIVATLELLQIQATRLREELDKTTNTSERMKIERLICDLNSKILYHFQKITSSIIRSNQQTVALYNNKMKEMKMSDRRVSFLDLLSVSQKEFEKIQKILEDDRKPIR